MVLFPVNVHRSPCDGQKVPGHPLCLHQDHSWVRQSIPMYCSRIGGQINIKGPRIGLQRRNRAPLETKITLNFDPK
jgi:hypothetical protein